MSKHPIPGSRGGMAPTASRRIVPPLLVAALALAGATAPLTAQSATFRAGEVIIQNNRDVPVTVYLDIEPVEKRLGTVEPMRTATFALPPRALRGDQMKLLIQPRGDFALEARAALSGRSNQFGLLIPPRPGQELYMPGERLATGTQNAAPVSAENAASSGGNSQLDG